MRKKILPALAAAMLLVLFASCRETADAEEERGRIVFYDSEGIDLLSIDAKGGVFESITQNDIVSSVAAHSLSNTFARGANFLAYTTGNDLCIYNLENSVDYLSVYPAGSAISYISVSPDQQFIGIVTNPSAFEYLVLPSSGGSPANISFSLNEYSDISWSPDSRFITYISDLNGADNLEVRIGASDGSSERQLTNTGGLSVPREPKWSPLGDRILYVNNITTNYNIYSVKTDGTDLFTHTTTAISATYPAWSPDASRIAYLDNSQVFVVDADGTSLPYPLLSGFTASDVRWSYYGTRLLVTVDYNGNDIFSVDPETGEYLILTNGTGNQMHPRWLLD